MNENEQLARWLGWTDCVRCGSSDPSCNYLTPPGGIFQTPPVFRQSNEWAGALLEKLAPYLNFLSPATEDDGKWEISLHFGDEIWVTGHCGSLRDAVVDAALEVIRREGAA